MPDVISKGFARLLPAALQVPGFARMLRRALEVADEDLSEILPAIDDVSWQMI
jgi:L-serine deaminase